MAQLSYTLRDLECPDGQNAVIVELNGSVDPSSIDDFDAIFDDLLEKGSIRIVMDLAKLKYINSTGMGMMVQYYDQLADEGGGLVLMTVQAKIILVLEMLGLQELFPIVSSEEEAVAALMGKSVKPANVEVKLEESVTPQSQSAASLSAACGSCGADLIVGSAGTYLCPRCRAVIDVDKQGRTHTSAPSSADSVEIAIPASPAFYKSAAALMARIGIKAGLTDSDAMGAAASIQATLSRMSDLCIDERGRDDHRLQMIGCAGDGHFEVRVFCGGRSLGDQTEFAGCKTGFDKLELKAVPGGSIVALSKAVG